MKLGRQVTKLGGRLVGLVLVVCIVVAANVILGTLSLRLDLTEERLYTLSRATRDIVDGLQQPVVLKLFFNSSSPEVPMHLKNYARRVEDLLREYELASGGKVVIEKYDPKPDSDAEDLARRFGVNGRQLGFMGPMLYLGLVAASGDAEATLPALDPGSENLLEYNITRMITRLATPDKPVVGVMSGLPVMGSERPPYQMPGQPPPQKPWFAFRDLGADYEVRKLDPSVDAIPADLDALVLVHPKDLSDGTLFAIDQFVLGGGKLVAFVDPMCVVEAQTQQTMPQMQFQPKSSNLEKLFEAWGVSYEPGKVVADLEAMSRLQGMGNRIEESPVWLSLRKSHMNADDILTARLESVMMPYAGSFDVAPSAGLEITPLITSSPSSGLVDGMMAQFSADSVRREFKSGLTSLNLAVRLHGRLDTAFPDGDPADADDEVGDGEDAEASEDKDEAAGPVSLAESRGKSTVIVVGDVDMLYDRFCVREVGFFGLAEAVNDNLSFLFNAVEQVAGSAALVGIRTRGKSERPFDVVLKLQREAQERYLAEETRLQEKLNETQRRLGELQTKKDSKQQLFLSPEQQAEIQRFEKEMFETRKQLKLVRRKLREDIERLGVRIKVMNILLMPALVACAGVGFWFYRRQKTRS